MYLPSSHLQYSTIPNGNSSYPPPLNQTAHTSQNLPTTSWHPYMGSHPGIPSQFSSCTPDSGIQSIDGSPPSVSSYTPPMVSPYMTQATSCESNASTQFQPALVPPSLVSMSSVSRAPGTYIEEKVSSGYMNTIDEDGEKDEAGDLSDMPKLKPFHVDYVDPATSTGDDSAQQSAIPPSKASISPETLVEKEEASVVVPVSSEAISLSELAKHLSMEQVCAITIEAYL